MIYSAGDHYQVFNLFFNIIHVWPQSQVMPEYQKKYLVEFLWSLSDDKDSSFRKFTYSSLALERFRLAHGMESHRHHHGIAYCWRRNQHRVLGPDSPRPRVLASHGRSRLEICQFILDGLRIYESRWIKILCNCTLCFWVYLCGYVLFRCSASKA